jgi:hypothetical protein
MRVCCCSTSLPHAGLVGIPAIRLVTDDEHPGGPVLPPPLAAAGLVVQLNLRYPQLCRRSTLTACSATPDLVY